MTKMVMITMIFVVVGTPPHTPGGNRTRNRLRLTTGVVRLLLINDDDNNDDDDDAGGTSLWCGSICEVCYEPKVKQKFPKNLLSEHIQGCSKP